MLVEAGAGAPLVCQRTRALAAQERAEWFLLPLEAGQRRVDSLGGGGSSCGGGILGAGVRPFV